MEFFRSLGVIGIPLVIVLLLLLVHLGRTIRDWRQLGAEAAATPRIHTLLVLGVLGACLGVLGTLVGVWMAAGAIAAAGEVSPALAWGGIRVALTSSIFGFLILGIAAIAWLGLQYAEGRRSQSKVAP